MSVAALVVAVVQEVDVVVVEMARRTCLAQQQS